MKNIIIVSLLVMGIGFSYGVRPAFDLNAGWQYLHSGSYNENYLTIGIGTTVPYTRYFGLTADCVGFLLGNGQTSIMVSGNIGFIEMIPTPYISPYFKEQVLLNTTISGGHSATDLGLSGGIGLEFLGNFYISPFIEGNFGWEHLNVLGSTANEIGFNVGGGVRFSWIK